MDSLFSSQADDIANDYLGFLAERVPFNLREQLEIDSQPDLGLSSSLGIDALIEPLAVRQFSRSQHRKIADLTGYVTLSYLNSISDTQEDPYKVIYIASLYLYNYVHGNGPEASGYSSVLGVLVEVSSRVDLESRLQICRFLSALVPSISATIKLYGNLADEDAPLSSVQIAIAIIAGHILSDIADNARRAIKSEGLVKHWATDQSQEKTADWGIRTMLKHLADLYREDGGEVRAASDTLSAVVVPP